MVRHIILACLVGGLIILGLYKANQSNQPQTLSQRAAEQMASQEVPRQVTKYVDMTPAPTPNLRHVSRYSERHQALETLGLFSRAYLHGQVVEWPDTISIWSKPDSLTVLIISNPDSVVIRRGVAWPDWPHLRGKWVQKH